MNPNFEFLKDAFKRFASKYSGKDIADGLKQSPKAFVEKMAKDVSDFITSQEVADGVSGMVRVDEEQVRSMIERMTDGLKNEEKARQMAQQIKQFLDMNSAESLKMQIDGLVSYLKLSPEKEMMARLMIEQLGPKIEEWKSASEEDLTYRIMAFADNLPVDRIVGLVAGAGGNVTPEAISRKTTDFVAGMPSPSAIGQIVSNVGETAKKCLDDVKNNPSELKNVFKKFVDGVTEGTKNIVEQDKQDKKTFKKDEGDSFDI